MDMGIHIHADGALMNIATRINIHLDNNTFRGKMMAMADKRFPSSKYITHSVKNRASAMMLVRLGG